MKNARNRQFARVSEAKIEEINKVWEDNEKTSMMWEVINKQAVDDFMDILRTMPEAAHVRSKDGRGPMFWAHEYGRKGMITVLRKLGVSEDRADANGVKPTDITHPSIKGHV
jgi:dolichyl-diphosphooligosaccharide--protein glycosyltransferase